MKHAERHIAGAEHRHDRQDGDGEGRVGLDHGNSPIDRSTSIAWKAPTPEPVSGTGMPVLAVGGCTSETMYFGSSPGACGVHGLNLSKYGLSLSRISLTSLSPITGPVMSMLKNDSVIGVR